MIDPLVTAILSLSLALLFFLAARHKLASPRHFQARLAAYRLLPATLTPGLSRVLPCLELAVAVGLLVPFARPFAALTAAVLLILYAQAMAMKLWRGEREIDCGCGARPQPLSQWLLLRNFALAGLALFLLLPPASRQLGLADTLCLVLLTAVLALSYALVDQLIHNHSALAK